MFEEQRISPLPHIKDSASGAVKTPSIAVTNDVSMMCCAPGTPIPYESLRSYFKSDPASSWGAYVAGCLLVLAHEKGATFPDGISILVASDVPEGMHY
jgi:galactokinase